MPHEYLPVIFGDTPGGAAVLGDLADVQEVMSLLMRYWNSIAEDFQHETVHLAYIEENGVDGIQGAPGTLRAYLAQIGAAEQSAFAQVETMAAPIMAYQAVSQHTIFRIGSRVSFRRGRKTAVDSVAYEPIRVQPGGALLSIAYDILLDLT
jgi:hypothetical protein